MDPRLDFRPVIQPGALGRLVVDVKLRRDEMKLRAEAQARATDIARVERNDGTVQHDVQPRYFTRPHW